MATMNVSVPDRMRDWVQSRIDSGQYASVSDYIRDLIRRDQTQQDHAAALTRMDTAIEAGLADLAAGRMRPAEEVFDRLEAKYAAITANGAKP